MWNWSGFGDNVKDLGRVRGVLDKSWWLVKHGTGLVGCCYVLEGFQKQLEKFVNYTIERVKEVLNRGEL